MSNPQGYRSQLADLRRSYHFSPPLPPAVTHIRLCRGLSTIPRPCSNPIWQHLLLLETPIAGRAPLTTGKVPVSPVLRRVACIALLLSMYACGGGDSDGGGGGTGVRGLTASSASLTFSMNGLYGTPPRQEITITAASADWHLRFDFPPPFNPGTISKPSPTQYVIPIGAQSGAIAGVGTFSGDLVVTACAVDDAVVCARQVAGPLRIRLTNTITGVGIASGFGTNAIQANTCRLHLLIRAQPQRCTPVRPGRPFRACLR